MSNEEFEKQQTIFSESFHMFYYKININKDFSKEIKSLQEENSFLKEKCRLLEEEQNVLIEEKNQLLETFSKINEELELYKSIFLVKNLEIKFRQKKENLFKTKFTPIKYQELITKKNGENIINEGRNKNDNSKEKDKILKSNGDFKLHNFLNFYERFGVCLFF